MPDRNPTHPERTADLHEQIVRRLSQNEQRYTSGRRRLVEVLAAAIHPLTLPEIVSLEPDLTQSSTYRNLEILERSGIVRRLIAHTDHAHFELAEPLLGHHHHLICDGCGTIIDIHLDDDLEALVEAGLSDAAAMAGFTPAHHVLDLHGRCRDCDGP